MPLDIFTITVYCWVVQYYAEITTQHPIRGRGFDPQLTDAEVITMEIVGEYLGLATDQDLFEYFYRHWRHFFPKLQDRTVFVRQAANLWIIKGWIWRRITEVSGEAGDPIQITDTLPLPVGVLTRGPRDKCFTGQADYGYCAAKDQHYYGFKEGLRISRRGMIVHCPRLAARPHDVEHIEELLEGFSGLALGDKGFISKDKKRELQHQGVNLPTPLRKNMRDDRSPAFRYWLNRRRRLVETVNSQLVGRFHIQMIRVRDLWHLQSRLIRKVLSHTVAVYLNLKLGRDPLDLDSLVIA